MNEKQLNSTYPIVRDITPSQTTAMLLKNLLFCADGFLTGHLTYMYQSWYYDTDEKVFGNYLAQLAKSNGDILDALGKITFTFGGDPNFMTSNARSWTSQNLILNRNRNAFIKSATSMEQRAIKNLNNAIEQVENDSLKTLLTTIRDDKEKIIQDLGNFLN